MIFMAGAKKMFILFIPIKTKMNEMVEQCQLSFTQPYNSKYRGFSIKLECKISVVLSVEVLNIGKLPSMWYFKN